MEEVDFYKLARPVQERFVGSVNGTGLPTPILEIPGGPREPLLWVGIGAAGFLVFLVLVVIGYGDPESALGLQPAWMMALETAALTTGFAGMLRAAALTQATRSLPYRPGVYAFPIGVIDARRSRLRIFRMHDLLACEGPDAARGFRLAFQGGGAFQFHAKDDTHAQQASQQLSASRGQVVAATSARDSVRPNALAALDPLQGVANPLRPSTPIVAKRPAWVAHVWLVSLAAGFLAALAMWTLRNFLSDERMYARVVAANDTASFRAYLEHGSRHDDEVSRVLLPRAELREAETAGTPEAIYAYIKAHPGSKIQAEVDGVLKKALLAKLEQAKQPGTLTALQEFAKTYPEHHLDAELAAARHAVYAKALERFAANAPDKAPIGLVERLLAFAEKSGSRVDVRFRKQLGKSIESADKAVQKSRYFMGVISAPSRYLDDPHTRPREADMGKQIVARFTEAFPPDMIAMQVGDPVLEPEGPLPQVTVPTLFVDYDLEWAGVIVTNDGPRGVWAALGVVADLSFTIPDGQKPSRFKHQAWRRPDMNLVKADPTARPEEKVYDTEQRECFDAVAKHFLATYFKPPPK